MEAVDDTARALSPGQKIGMLIAAVVVIVAAGFVLWASTLGRDWSSTHNKLGRPIPRISARQERINVVVGLVGAAVAMVGAAAILVAVVVA